MANLDKVIIFFQCKHCQDKMEMTAAKLMEASTKSPPICYCNEENDELNVIGAYFKRK